MSMGSKSGRLVQQIYMVDKMKGKGGKGNLIYVTDLYRIIMDGLSSIRALTNWQHLYGRVCFVVPSSYLFLEERSVVEARLPAFADV